MLPVTFVKILLPFVHRKADVFATSGVPLCTGPLDIQRRRLATRCVAIYTTAGRTLVDPLRVAPCDENLRTPGTCTL